MNFSKRNNACMPLHLRTQGYVGHPHACPAWWLVLGAYTIVVRRVPYGAPWVADVNPALDGPLATFAGNGIDVADRALAFVRNLLPRPGAGPVAP